MTTKDSNHILYTVFGKWPFPADMLRHDCANAAEQSDQDLIDLLVRDHTDENVNPRDRYSINLVIPAEHARFGPNIERWKSFGWTVAGISQNQKNLKVEDFARPGLYADRLPKTSPHKDLRAAVRAHIDAVTAFRDFERDNPNDSTRRWEAVFEAKCNTYDALVKAADLSGA